MTLQFGFELEGFYFKDGELELPPSHLPRDGYPLLVEARTEDGKPLTKAFTELLGKVLVLPTEVDFSKHQVVPSAKLKQKIRQSGMESKSPLTVTNLYGRGPRDSGNRQLASFQISVSKVLAKAYTDSKGQAWPVRYTLFDYVPVVRKLDKLFEKEIKDSGRQPGVYAIKGFRFEYRSLPNNVINFRSMEEARVLLNKLKGVFNV